MSSHGNSRHSRVTGLKHGNENAPRDDVALVGKRSLIVHDKAGAEAVSLISYRTQRGRECVKTTEAPWASAPKARNVIAQGNALGGRLGYWKR